MSDTSKIRKSLKASHVVKVWFWDGVREYLGEAVEISAERVTALLKMSQFGTATLVPTRKIVEGLTRHLTQRVVELKCTSGILEASVRAKITLVQLDFENARRLLVEADFQSPSEHNQRLLRRMSEILRPAGPL